MLNLDDLSDLLASAPEIYRARVAEFSLAGCDFPFNSRPAIMGVINLSPDSWYRESVCLSPNAAICRAHVLRAQGADLVDIGAESTLAHAARADEASQLSRILPIISHLRSEGILVSVETYDTSVARRCLEAGANVLNFTGSEPDSDLLRLVADQGAAVILCYVQGRHVREAGDFNFSADPIALMHEYFARRLETAQQAGVRKILIDPGLGFYYRNLGDSATRVRHQMRVFLSSFRLRDLGFPICNALPHAFEYFGEEVRCAEPFFATLAALGKTDLFRTHEVPRIKAVLDTLSVFRAH
jgi:dihydropteroate synthase